MVVGVECWILSCCSYCNGKGKGRLGDIYIYMLIGVFSIMIWCDSSCLVVLSSSCLVSIVAWIVWMSYLMGWEWWWESALMVFDHIFQPAFASCLCTMEMEDYGFEPWDTYPTDWASGIRRGSLHGLGSVRLMGFLVWSPQQWCFHWDYG